MNRNLTGQLMHLKVSEAECIGDSIGTIFTTTIPFDILWKTQLVLTGLLSRFFYVPL